MKTQTAALDAAMRYLDTLPIGNGGHPHDNIEKTARVCGVSQEAIRARLHSRRVGR